MILLEFGIVNILHFYLWNRFDWHFNMKFYIFVDVICSVYSLFIEPATSAQVIEFHGFTALFCRTFLSTCQCRDLYSYCNNMYNISWVVIGFGVNTTSIYLAADSVINAQAWNKKIIIFSTFRFFFTFRC